MILALKVLEKFHPNPLDAIFYISSFFRYNFRPEVDNEVISYVAADYAGMDVHVKCGDSRSNGSRDIRNADFVSNKHDRSLSHMGERGVSPNND